MRHGVFGRKLNRDVKERRALFANLLDALVLHGKIQTTVSKAKAIRGMVEKTVTLAKSNTNVSKSRVTSYLPRKEAFDLMTKDIAPRFKDVAGGYTRIVRLGKRSGDGSEMVRLEWSIESVKKESPVKNKETKKVLKAEKDSVKKVKKGTKEKSKKLKK